MVQVMIDIYNLRAMTMNSLYHMWIQYEINELGMNSMTHLIKWFRLWLTMTSIEHSQWALYTTLESNASATQN